MGLAPAVRLAALVGTVLGTAACGSEPATPDAMPDAAPRCDPSAPFAAPVPVEGLNTMLDDVCARLSPDELLVVFSRRQMTGVYDLYQATRSSRDEPFGAVELLATVNSINSDVWPSLSPDGLTLVFDTDRGQPGMYRAHISRRASTDERFGTAVPLDGLLVGEVHMMLANAGSLYFSSPTGVRPGQGSSDLWRVSLADDGTLGTPESVLGGVNSPDEEVAAALTEDELRIYFRRVVGTEHEIFTASRSTVNDGFGAATVVQELSVDGVNEVPTWISADNCNLYFHSNAPDGVGGADLYVARRGSP